MAEWHAIVPLAVLEAIREIDRPAESLEDLGEDIGPKRLGNSPTVAAQIDRLAGLAARDVRVDSGEVVGLFRLLGRRDDAERVFAEAGRRAAERAVHRTSSVLKLLLRAMPGPIRWRLGYRMVRRAARDVLGVEVGRDGTALWPDSSLAVRATPPGVACSLFGTAVAELVAAFRAFDGSLIHTTCEARGGEACRWSTQANIGE